MSSSESGTSRSDSSDSDSEAEELLSGFSFNPSQHAYMKEKVVEYREVDSKGKPKFVIRVARHLQTEIERQTQKALPEEQWQSLLAGVRTWFRHNSKQGRKEKPTWATNWNPRLVFIKLHRSKILALSEAMVSGDVDVKEWDRTWRPGKESGSRAGRNPKTKGKKGEEADWFFNHYQAATTALISLLPPGEFASYRLIAEKWRREGPPREVQQQMADKMAAKKAYDFIVEMHREYGCVVYLLLGWRGEEPKPVAVEMDLNTELGCSSSFVQHDPKKMKRLFGDFRDYVYRVFKSDDEDSDGEANVATVKTPGGRRELLEMRRNGYNEPFLPSAMDGRVPGEARGDWYIRAIRSFFTYHYGKGHLDFFYPWLTITPIACSRGSKTLVGFPWRRFAEDRRQFIAERFMPDSIVEVLKEPSEMTVPERISVFDHIYKIQRKARNDDERADMLSFEIRSIVNSKGEIVSRVGRE
ncbi:hypothetical protein BKA70DRAFT_1096405, partial [Coprinopsis sp. MPI-PUGE-AT-0042]